MTRYTESCYPQCSATTFYLAETYRCYKRCSENAFFDLKLKKCMCKVLNLQYINEKCRPLCEIGQIRDITTGDCVNYCGLANEVSVKGRCVCQDGFVRLRDQSCAPQCSPGEERSFDDECRKPCGKDEQFNADDKTCQKVCGPNQILSESGTCVDCTYDENGKCILPSTCPTGVDADTGKCAP